MLAKRWTEHQDRDAAHKLVTSHLRLVARIAMGYRGYGLPLIDLISEGNIGLMKGVKKFDPDRGFRLATYAMWWIRASIQEFVLRSWSMVKIGTTAAQKKLFFNLRRLKAKIKALGDESLKSSEVKQIAQDLNVPEKDVVNMDQRMAMGGDSSLSAPMSQGDGDSWQDWIADTDPLQDELLEDRQETDLRRQALTHAIGILNDRERDIFHSRRLAEVPKTLEELSQHYGISRERVRQIEARAFEKVQESIREAL